MEPVNYQRPAASADSIQEGARIVANAKNPLIYAGGGVNLSGANDALLALAEHLQAPVIETAEGKGAISDRHYLSLGVPRRIDPYHDHMAEHDVILAVGTRIQTPQILRGQRVVQVDIDEAELGRNYENTFGIAGDAKATLEDMLKVVSSIKPAQPSREAEIEEMRKEFFGKERELEPLHSLSNAVRAAMPDDGILVAGMTQVGYYSRTRFPVYEPNTYLTSSYFGNLGFAYPCALGAKVACPDKAVVAVSGDGGFMYNVQELATAVMYGINAVVVVFNDSAFGNVRRDQSDRFNGRIYGSELHNPGLRKAGGVVRSAGRARGQGERRRIASRAGGGAGYRCADADRSADGRAAVSVLDERGLTSIDRIDRTGVGFCVQGHNQLQAGGGRFRGAFAGSRG